MGLKIGDTIIYRQWHHLARAFTVGKVFRSGRTIGVERINGDYLEDRARPEDVEMFDSLLWERLETLAAEIDQIESRLVAIRHEQDKLWHP